MHTDMAPAMPHDAFEHVTDWVFDLDNTLYPASSSLFPQIEMRMTQFIMRELKLNESEAATLRRHYWREHGTTLAGLMREHDMDPDPFLHAVHDIDLNALDPDHTLRAAISELPGRKIVYTNGSRTHAARVIEARGLTGVFAAYYGVEDAGYSPKPHLGAFEKVFAQDGLDTSKAAMFEDEERNLRVPHELQMRTILVGDPHDGVHVHHNTDDLSSFLQRLL